ncbi:MAG: hypothetical protein ACREKH_10265, partial [Candidatus Rokuibacteriota bacterium]
ITGSPEETYSYVLEAATPETVPEPVAGLTVPLETPERKQRVLRITATEGVHVEQEHRDEGLDLAVHIARIPAADWIHVTSGESFHLPMISETGDERGAHLSLDQTAIDIAIIEDGARYAYSIDPDWSGDGSGKVVHVVATAGVRVVEQAVESPIGKWGSFQRKLVLDLARVQDPAQVPQQGEEVDPSQHTGSRLHVGTDPNNPLGGLRTHTGRGGVTVQEPRTGARLRISAEDESIGAHFAYQIIPRGNTGGPGTVLDPGGAEIRVVVGPGAIVSITEPLPQSITESPLFFAPLGAESKPGDNFRESGVDFLIFRVDDPQLVPSQGEAIDADLFAGIGKRQGPDHHEIVQSPEQQVDFAVADILTSIGPTGDMGDVADVNNAMTTGKDRWGNEMSGGDYGILAAGAALPFVGAGALRGGRRLLGLSRLADRLGKSLD